MLLNLLVAVAYFLAARMGLALAFVEQKVTLVWPATAVALAAVLILGRRVLPGVVVGALAANLSTGSPLIFSLATAIGNPLEALAASWLLERVPGFDRSLSRVRHVVVFVVVALVLIPPLSATPGVIGLCLSGEAPWRAFGSIWSGWCLGDGMGALLFGPALFAWRARDPEREGSWWELAVLTLAVGALGSLLFLSHIPAHLSYLPLPYFLLPLPLWAAIRFGPWGASTVVALISALALTGTVTGHGPFMRGAMQENFVLLLAFMSIIAFVALVLGAIMAERNAAERRAAGAFGELENRVAERTRQLVEASEKIRSSEELLQQLIRHTPAAVAMLDRDMRYLQASERWLTDYHLDGRDIIGRSHYEIFPDIPERWKAIHRRVLAGEVERCDEDPFPRADGSTEWLQWECRPWRKADGTIGGAIFFTQVITARIRTEQALRTSEADVRHSRERFELAARGAVDGIWDWNVENDELYLSDRWLELLGYQPGELPYKVSSWSDHLHPDDKERVFNAVRGHIRHHTAYDEEYRLRTKSGEYRWYRARGQAKWNGEGQAVRMAGSLTDITSRRESEAALRESEAQFRALAEETPVGVYLIQDNRFRYVNASLANFYGYTREELLALPDVLATVVEEEQPRILENIQRRLNGEVAGLAYEFTARRKDGGRRIMSVVGAATHFGGKPAILGTAKDITERRLAEQALKESLAEKEILLREIHHRVKNNMQVVSSILSLQANNVEDEQARALFADCQTRVQSMAMIHEKLYRSPNLATIAFDVHLRELSEMLVASFGESGVRARLVTEAEPLALDIDTAIPLGLILSELIINALKYAFPEGRSGTLKVSSRPEKPGWMLLSVADDGVGLPAQFDLEQGRSVGLKMIRSLTRQLRGRLEIVREQGVEFRVFYPLPESDVPK